MRTVVLRVVALSLLLLLALVAIITIRTLQRLPDTLIYFVRDEGVTFVLDPVARVGRESGLTARVKAQMAALASGPSAEESAEGLSSVVPKTVEVRGVNLEGGRLTVDLSRDFAGGGGSASMLGRLYQVMYTLSQPADVDEVLLLLEGEPLTLLGGEGILVEVPWVRDEHVELPRW